MKKSVEPQEALVQLEELFALLKGNGLTRTAGAILHDTNITNDFWRKLLFAGIIERRGNVSNPTYVWVANAPNMLMAEEMLKDSPDYVNIGIVPKRRDTIHRLEWEKGLKLWKEGRTIERIAEALYLSESVAKEVLLPWLEKECSQDKKSHDIFFRLEYNETQGNFHFDNYTHEENTAGWITIAERLWDRNCQEFTQMMYDKFPSLGYKLLLILSGEKRNVEKYPSAGTIKMEFEEFSKDPWNEDGTWDKKIIEKNLTKGLNILFETFWNLYDKKVGDRDAVKQIWQSLLNEDKKAILEYIPKYKIARPEKIYRKNPLTFLTEKCWNDEIVTKTFINSPTPSKVYHSLSDYTDQQLVEELIKRDIQGS